MIPYTMAGFRSVSMKKEPRDREVMSSSLRCFQALEVLAGEPYRFGLTEIGSALGVTKGTAHRVMATLVKAGLVEQNGDDRLYQLAGKALWIGTGYLRHSPVYRLSFGSLEELARRTNAMAHLAVWDNDRVLYLHTVGPPRRPNLFSDTGERRPVHATGLGKLLLAFRPETDIARVLRPPVEKLTANTITGLAAMRKDLQRVRQQGFAIDDEEGIPGLACIAAPVRDARSNVIAAISASGQRSEILGERFRELAQTVQQTALGASIQLGYRPPTANISFLTAVGS